MRTQKIVKTMETGKEVTSIEIIEQGQHITTADGNEVTLSCHHTHGSAPTADAIAAILHFNCHASGEDKMLVEN